MSTNLFFDRILLQLNGFFFFFFDGMKREIGIT